MEKTYLGLWVNMHSSGQRGKLNGPNANGETGPHKSSQKLL